jgi:protein-S-isoprenylcysteine O-methyltransferase Ste14
MTPGGVRVQSSSSSSSMIKSLYCHLVALGLLALTAISFSEAFVTARSCGRPQRSWLAACTRAARRSGVSGSIGRSHIVLGSSTDPTKTYESYYFSNPAPTAIPTDVATAVATASTNTNTASSLQPYQSHPYPTLHNDDNRDDVMDKFQESWNQWILSSQQALPDVASLTEHAPQIATNIVNGGDLGDRGEIFVVLQVALVAALTVGSAALPSFIGVPLELWLGPIVMVLGAIVGLYAGIELGPCLSPWPVPANIFEELVVTGVYARVRHPLYAGLLAVAIGFAVATHSAVRLLLTVALWYILDRQADYEEDQLQDIYPEYRAYRRQVTGKFWPRELWQWSFSYPPEGITAKPSTGNGDSKGTLPSREDRRRGARTE